MSNISQQILVGWTGCSLQDGTQTLKVWKTLHLSMDRYQAWLSGV